MREHGRGMFVGRAKITQELAPARDAYRLPQASGSWASRVLEFTTVQAGARVGRRLHISPAAEITYIARLRLVDNEPMAIEYLHVPAALVPGLRPDDMESGDFYDFLRERHGVRVHEAVQSIEPTVTNEEEARLIGVPVLSPALLFERLTKDTAGRPVEYVHSVYRGDRYRIVSRLALGATASATPCPPPSTTRASPGRPRLPRGAGDDHRGRPARILTRAGPDPHPRARFRAPLT